MDRGHRLCRGYLPPGTTKPVSSPTPWDQQVKVVFMVVDIGGQQCFFEKDMPC